MARLPRIVIPHQPLHIIHRGNNRQDIFESEDDMARIKADIAQALSKFNCQLHAYVIMTNHLHLLLTPPDKQQLSGFMQTIANRYVRYYNSSRKRTGTIWEGRYKSCLVDSDHYLFILHRYIEMNPVKANMVKDMADYPWSSYSHNALGKKDSLISEHDLYTALANTSVLRAQEYLNMIGVPNTPRQEQQITSATMNGGVYGTDVFHKKVGKLISRPTKRTKHGGDRKSKEYKNQAA